MDKQKFSERLIIAMDKKGISAADLSRLSGVSEAVISQYKKGLYEPRNHRLEMFAKLLDVSAAWLMGFDVSMQREISTDNNIHSNKTIEEKRLKLLRENNNLTIEEAAKEINVNQNVLLRWENGDIDRLNLDYVWKMRVLYKTNELYIMGKIDDPSDNALDLVKETGIKGYYAIGVIEKIEKGIHRYIHKIISGYHVTQVEKPDEHFCINVLDERMETQIIKGDIALIHEQYDVNNGDIAAVVFDGKVKLYRYIIEGKNIILQSFNSQFAPLVYSVDKKASLMVVGKLISTFSRKEW